MISGNGRFLYPGGEQEAAIYTLGWIILVRIYYFCEESKTATSNS